MTPIYPPNGSAHLLFKAAHPFLKMLGTGGPFWLAGAEVSLRPVLPAGCLGLPPAVACAPSLSPRAVLDLFPIHVPLMSYI